MSTPPQDRSDERLDWLRREWRTEKLQGFNDDSLAWLALVPEWTEELAAAASFPPDPLKLGDFLTRASAAGICEREGNDGGAETAQRGAHALMALWPRLDEPQKRKYAAALRERAQLMPGGQEQRRILREAERSLAPPDTSWTGRVSNLLGFGSSASPNAPQEVANPLDALLAMIVNLKEGNASWRDLGSLTTAAAAAAGASIISPVLNGLSRFTDAQAVLRAVAPLVSAFPEDGSIGNFIDQQAHRLDPETRAQALLYVAPRTRSPLGVRLQLDAIGTLRNVVDPATRAVGFLNAAPEVDAEFHGETVREVLQAARQVDAPALRAQLLAAALPLLGLTERTELGAELAKLSGNVSDVSLKTSVLAAAAAALGEGGRMTEARNLVASGETPLARAQILFEIVPAMTEGAAPLVRESIGQIAPPALEQVLSNLSQKAGEAVALLEPLAVVAAVRNAIAVGHFANAGKLAGFLGDRARPEAMKMVLDGIRGIFNLQERLEAVGEVAAYLPAGMLDAACSIASDFRTATRFCVALSAKVDVIEYLRAKNNPTYLCVAAINAGTTLDKAGKLNTVDVPVRTARWAAIASLCGNMPVAGAFVTTRIREAVDSASTVEALEILSTAAELAKVVGAELEPAVALGRHTIQLAFRQAADERHLARYLPRQEQIDDFQKLINEPDDTPESKGNGTPEIKGNPYALHYLGMGGVGKTMLLRHITGRLAVKNGAKLPTTRVDFDHISPDYPARKPGELLVSLAEELRLYGGPGQESRFNDFMNHLVSVHAALSVDPTDDPLKNVRNSDMFDLLLDKFAALLYELPKPVIFILDTCEELAKVEPAGAILPSVEATFLILQKLHEKVPQIRVVFAGRRLLAQAGDKPPGGSHQWTAVAESLSARNQLLPVSKDYLRLHIVRGFTGPEAASYFTSIAQLSLSPERQEAILGASPDAGPPADITWSGTPPLSASEEIRYNPFDLSLYAEWVRAVPGLAIETIRSRKTDPYVETRIEGRIFDETIRAALPAVVLMRRFDVNMLREVVGEDAVAQAYRDLGGQEWIDYQQDALQVDLNLLPRLNDYYQHDSRRYLSDDARTMLGPALARLIREAMAAPNPFAGLTVANVDATLRLLPAWDAASIWDEIDRQICTHCNWHWAENLCRYLLVEGNAAGPAPSTQAVPTPPPNRLGAAVRATMAAAALHKPPYQPLLTWWKEVAANAQHHPAADLREWLEIRANVVGDTVADATVISVRQLRGGDGWRYDQAVAGFVSALERQWDSGLPIPDSDFISDDDVSLEVRAFLACLYARNGIGIETAKKLAAEVPQAITHQRWADWRAPACIRDRVRIELLRAGRTSVSGEEMLQWSAEAAAKLDNPDSDRLLSRLLRLRLEVEVPDVSGIPLNAVYDPERRPLCALERQTPPLFSSVAEALLAAGKAAGASELINDVLKRAGAAGDNEAIAAVKLLTLRIKRRMRSADSLANTAELIGLEQPDTALFHRWWATQLASTRKETELLIAAAERGGPEAFRRLDGSVDRHLALDARELDLLGEPIGRNTSNAAGLWNQLENRPVDFRISLRASVLTSEEIPLLSESPRLAAELAMEEGELLALRLPRFATRLFDFAHSRFASAGDLFGEFQASVCYGMASLTAGEPLPKASKPDEQEGVWDVERIYKRCRERDPSLLFEVEHHPWADWLCRLALLRAWIREDKVVTGQIDYDLVTRRYKSVPQFDLGTYSEAPNAAGTQAWRGLAARYTAIVLVVGVAVDLLLWALVHHRIDLKITLEIAAGILMFGAVLFAALPYTAMTAFRLTKPRILLQPGYQKTVLVRFAAFRANLSSPEAKSFSQSSGRNAAGERDPGWLRLLDTAIRIISPFKQWVDSPDSAPIPQPGYEDYADVAGQLALLKPMLRIIGGRMGPATVTLLIDRTIARYAWEAPFTLVVASIFGEPQFVRLDDPLSIDSLGVRLWNTLPVQVLCRSALASVVEQAWKGIGRPVTFLPFPSGSTSGGVAAGVKHIIGTATRTTAGSQFSITRPGIGSDATNAGLDVRSVGGDRPALFVVQEEPAERIRRLDVDREQTAEARAWAVDLFTSGQQTVILIPALPLALARAVLEGMARELRGSKAPTLYRLLGIVRGMRAAIRSFSPEPSAGTPGLQGGMSGDEWKASLKELSLEVTLFTRSNEAQQEKRYIAFST